MPLILSAEQAEAHLSNGNRLKMSKTGWQNLLAPCRS